MCRIRSAILLSPYDFCISNIIFSSLPKIEPVLYRKQTKIVTSIDQISPGLRPTGRGISVLLLSVCLLVLGNNLQGTLIGVRAGLEGMGSVSIGMMMSAYYAGFSLGSIFLPHLIIAVGHIRTYAALASIASALTLAYVLVIFTPAWIGLRFFQGLCYSGMILVVESWLNGCSTRTDRGRVLATYGLVFWGSSAASQILLNVAEPSSFVLFCLVSILVSVALVPITLAPTRAPATLLAARMKLRRLHAISPVGVLGVLVSGLCIGGVWSMGPVFAQNINLDHKGISIFMGAIMAGTLISQWPLGRISDKIDRRIVIVISGAGAGLIGLVLALQQSYSLGPLVILVSAYGGLSFPLYSLSVAHVNDCVTDEESIGTASTLILLQGVGSALGPFVAGFVMGKAGPQGLFYFVSAPLIILALYGMVMITRREAVSEKIKRGFMAIPRISYVWLTVHTKKKPRHTKHEAEQQSTHSRI